MNNFKWRIIILLYAMESSAVTNHIVDVSKNENIVMSGLETNKLFNLFRRRKFKSKKSKSKSKQQEPINHYNPSFGYHPYWVNGSWVLDNSTDPIYIQNGMCTRQCTRAYIDYGVICGRNKYYEHMTFENYCVMHQSDCANKKGWLVVYRGECLKPLRTIPTRSDLIVSNALHYVEEFYRKYPTTTRVMMTAPNITAG